MTISPLLADAKSAHHAGDLERAIAGYRSVLEDGPDAATSNLLAIALDGSGRADEAESVLAHSHEVEPELADPAIRKLWPSSLKLPTPPVCMLTS